MEFISLFNKTALIYAIEKGYLEIFQLLIAKEGIDVNVENILNAKAFIKFEYNFLFYDV